MAPAMDASGTLTYTVAPYVNGTSTFDVKVQNNGSTANGGQNTSAVSTLTMQVRDELAPFYVRTGANDGASSLRAGITRGNTANLPLTIYFSLPAGTNTVSLTSALAPLTSNFTIVGPTTPQVTIQRSSTTAFRIFTITSGSDIISNLTLTNGSAPTTTTGDSQRGGAIAIGNLGTLDLSWATLNYNQAGDGGGAIDNAGSLNVFGCSLEQNQAAYKGGAILNRGTATISDTQVAANTAGAGGGIFNFIGYQLTINSGSQIYANWTTGAVPADGTFAWGGAGGGIYNVGTLIMSDSVLGWNTSINEGGGLFTNGGMSTLTNVSITNNGATGNVNGKGGGIYVRRGTVTLVSGCTIADNTATVEIRIQDTGFGVAWADGDGRFIGGPVQDSVTFDSNARQ